MFLVISEIATKSRCFPRARGDVPPSTRTNGATPQFSPRTRGCSSSPTRGLRRGPVFPAHAGMFRGTPARVMVSRGFPRARGDVPQVKRDLQPVQMFSPRTRGCSAKDILTESCFKVFPAHAGMFRIRPFSGRYRPCFPRARGDVPDGKLEQRLRERFSPRTRGCSIGVSIACTRT